LRCSSRDGHDGRGIDRCIGRDAGRHAEHTQQILAFAHQTQRPIKAIINSHWHLDRIGGNSRIRSAYPDVRIYASGALKGAPPGFLADYRRDLEGALQDARQSASAGLAR
jgi:glyoxylase-like metal-dependent hydrolase (beta-lactamase superfamily II)